MPGQPVPLCHMGFGTTPQTPIFHFASPVSHWKHLIRYSGNTSPQDPVDLGIYVRGGGLEDSLFSKATDCTKHWGRIKRKYANICHGYETNCFIPKTDICILPFKKVGCRNIIPSCICYVHSLETIWRSIETINHCPSVNCQNINRVIKSLSSHTEKLF